MNAADQSRRVIEQLIPRLEAEGYTVYFEPARQLLPPFMGGYTPDAIALGPKKKIAIEVIVEGAAPKEKERDLRRLFAKAEDWDLNVYYVRPPTRQSKIPPVSSSAVETSIRSVEKLVADGQRAPALLMSWAILEALDRSLLPEASGSARSTAEIVEYLASSGHVTPSEADLLRKLASSRNDLVHGALGLEIGSQDLRGLIAILKELQAAQLSFEHQAGA